VPIVEASRRAQARRELLDLTRMNKAPIANEAVERIGRSAVTCKPGKELR